MSETKHQYATVEDIENTIIISLTPAQTALANEQQRKAERICIEALKKRLGASSGKAELVLDLERKGDDYVIVNAEVVITPEAPHNPETCRDPACHCFPF
jgi:hypothetical protein